MSPIISIQAASMLKNAEGLVSVVVAKPTKTCLKDSCSATNLSTSSHSITSSTSNLMEAAGYDCSVASGPTKMRSASAAGGSSSSYLQQTSVAGETSSSHASTTSSPVPPTATSFSAPSAQSRSEKSEQYNSILTLYFLILLPPPSSSLFQSYSTNSFSQWRRYH